MGWTVGEIASASVTNIRATVRLVAAAPLVMATGLMLAAFSQTDGATVGIRCRLGGGAGDRRHRHRDRLAAPVGMGDGVGRRRPRRASRGSHPINLVQLMWCVRRRLGRGPGQPAENADAAQWMFRGVRRVRRRGRRGVLPVGPRSDPLVVFVGGGAEGSSRHRRRPPCWAHAGCRTRDGEQHAAVGIAAEFGERPAMLLAEPAGSGPALRGSARR